MSEQSRLRAGWRPPAVLLGLAAYAAFVLTGVDRVPFHPDETSLLFQSRDLERYLTDPFSMAWSPGGPMDAEQRYRALNPPLPKYLLGLGRRLAGFPAEAVSVDWDWSVGWDANLERGALPPDRLLSGARLASASLLPLAIVFTYLLGRRLAGAPAGVLAAGLLGFNALFLLHGRRAMMEGALFFTLCLALLAILEADRRPLLAGLSVGLALSAKHSLLPLLPLGMLAALWSDGPARTRLRNLAVFAAGTLALVLLLAPFLWANPIAATARIWRERGSLVGDQLQTQAIAEHVAMQLPMSATDRLAAFLGQSFFAPPQPADTTTYQDDLAAQAAEYLRNPAHAWLRGWLFGGVLLGLTLTGVAAAAASVPRQASVERRRLALLLLGTAGMTLALYLAVPFPFQRYYLPVLPFVALWSAFALAGIRNTAKRLLSERAAVN